MDTKSRSIKPGLAFLALFFGVNLLILALAAGYSAVHTLGWHGISDAFQSDYQNTADFRRTISQWFYSFTDPSWQEQYQLSDKNLLYKVTQDGKTVATNADDLSPDALPEGYNFLLHFDGKTVAIQKDGQEVDVYGDGYYRGEDQWNLPGYRNMPVPQSYAGLTITMAAAKEPVAYIADAAALTGDIITDSGLYSTMDYASRLQLPLLLFVVVPLAVGTVLLLWSILWHKHKVRADQAIAWFTGKIWLEVKLVLLIPFFLVCIAAFFCLVSLYIARYHAIWFYLSVPVALWWAYLYINDLRYNFGRISANSLCALLARLYRGGELSWPAGQRMMRRSVLQFLAAVPFILGCIVVFLVLFRPSLYSFGPFLILILLALTGLFLIAAQLWLMRQNRRTAADVDALLTRIQAAGTGQAAAAPLPQDSDLRAAVEGLDQMEVRLKDALSEQMKSEKLKLELITNVSHDLKTPLTSMVSYTELLRQEEDLPDHVRDYILVLYQKTLRLQAMVQDVFDVSKAATGNLPVTIRPLDFAKLLRQTLADLDEDIQASGLVLRSTLPDGPVWIMADGDRLYRVFQNLIGNALKYALDGSRVYLTLSVEGNRAAAVIQNTSREELPYGVDFTERFVRGDQSRTDGGSGLGLSIARTFTEACGGSFAIRTQADLFTASVTFPLTQTRPQPEVAP